MRLVIFIYSPLTSVIVDKAKDKKITGIIIRRRKAQLSQILHDASILKINVIISLSSLIVLTVYEI